MKIKKVIIGALVAVIMVVVAIVVAVVLMNKNATKPEDVLVILFQKLMIKIMKRCII